MVVASLLSLLDFMLTREEASWKKEEALKKIFFFRPNVHTSATLDLLHFLVFNIFIYLFILAVMHFARPVLLRNEHFNAGLKVMCSQPAYLVIYFKEGSVVGRKSATNNLSVQAHAETHTDTHCWSPPLGLFVLLPSTFPPYTATPAPCLPRHLPHSCCVSTCTSLLLSLLALLKCETAWNTTPPTPTPLFFLWTKEVVGGSGANQKLWHRGSSSISAGNREPAWPSVAWWKKEFCLDLLKKAGCDMQKPTLGHFSDRQWQWCQQHLMETPNFKKKKKTWSVRQAFDAVMRWRWNIFSQEREK